MVSLYPFPGAPPPCLFNSLPYSWTCFWPIPNSFTAFGMQAISTHLQPAYTCMNYRQRTGSNGLRGGGGVMEVNLYVLCRKFTLIEGEYMHGEGGGGGGLGGR